MTRMLAQKIARATSTVSLLDPVSVSEFGVVGAWVPISRYEGALVVSHQMGVPSGGSWTGYIETASDDQGADLSVALLFESLSEAGIAHIVIEGNSVGGWIRYAVTGYPFSSTTASACLIATAKTV
jgi:hypothetical protein